MNIQCPNCETIFYLPKKEKSNKKYKCSVCNHIWVENTNKYKQLQKRNEAEGANFKKIIILNITISLLVILVFISFRTYLEDIDSNWKNLYLFFDMLIPI